MSMVLIRRIDMDAKLIKKMGRKLREFLGEFDDCFGRSGPREHLRTYVSGQLSDLPRKSIEPIALAAKVPPRTLQYFLSSMQWDQQRLRDRMQWMIARDHAHPKAIGVIDETGNPKKGRHTVGVRRQWCGNTGKVDNCVVGVHIAYVADDFQCLLDSDLYLPKEWAEDEDRRKEAGIPDEVVYRKKADIALEQVGRALKNGIRFSAWTFDEWYGRDGEFLDSMDSLGQSYIGEIGSDFVGWLSQPKVLVSPKPQKKPKRGRKRQFPRLSRKSLPACEVRNLATYSRIFQKQKWQRFRIKDGEKGPIVWEVKFSHFYRKHGENGLPGPTHTLIVARNVMNPKEVKYFLSNMVVGSERITFEWLLWVAFSRWPIERCFEVGKRELGMDHFEVRSWLGIHKHFYISQLSQLFCARTHHELREKKAGEFLPDGRAGSRRSLCLAPGSGFAVFSSKNNISGCRSENYILPKTKSRSQEIPLEKEASEASKIGYKNQSIEILCTA
jgi:SRSO17 transposase